MQRWVPLLESVLIVTQGSLETRITGRDTSGGTHCRERLRPAAEHDGQTPGRDLPIAVQRSLALLGGFEEAQLIPFGERFREIYLKVISD
jgi:hypothetical protein